MTVALLLQSLGGVQMYLKIARCVECKGPIRIDYFYDPRQDRYLVDRGICTNCGARYVLPNEDYQSFCREFGTEEPPTLAE